MSKCYRCDNNITAENESEEHIILNACGGRLKSKNLLCITCNNIYGSKFDAQLAKQTNDLANLLMIKRDNGEPQPIKVTAKKNGKDYYLALGGKPLASKPEISEEKVGERIQLSITAKNESQLRSILNGYKRKKYPDLNVEESIRSAKPSNEHIGPVTIQSKIGGPEVFKSIAKTAINFFIYKGGEKRHIQHLLPYLESEEELDIVWMHYPDENPYDISDNEVNHIIHLIGNSSDKILYVYIELFNVHNFIVKLNDNYHGPEYNETYIWNLIENKESTKTINLNYSREQLLTLFDNKNFIPIKNIQDRIQRILSILMKRKFNLAINKALSRVVLEGDTLTEENLNRITKAIGEEISTIIIDHLNSERLNRR
jgi:hypothetical protein